MPGQVLAAAGAERPWGPAGRVWLLGRFEVSWRGRLLDLPVGSQRLIAFLALTEHGAGRRSLSATLWPDTSETRAMANLRSALWRVRRVVPDLLEGRMDRLNLGPDVEVDVHDLDAVVRSAVDRPAELDRTDLRMIADAHELLPEWDDDWLHIHRERIRQLRLEALERVAEDLTARGLVGQAVEAGLAAVADEPFRESAHRVLIEAHIRKGNVDAALDQFRRYRDALRSELGVAPSAKLVERVRGLRRR